MYMLCWASSSSPNPGSKRGPVFLRRGVRTVISGACQGLPRAAAGPYTLK